MQTAGRPHQGRSPHCRKRRFYCPNAAENNLAAAISRRANVIQVHSASHPTTVPNPPAPVEPVSATVVPYAASGA